MNTCKVCGTKLKDNVLKCQYCGMPIAIDIDGSGGVEKLAQKHKERLFDKLKDFQFVTYVYKLENEKLSNNGRSETRLGNAKDCYENDIWSKEVFPQLPTPGTGTLTIIYTFDDKPQSVTFDIEYPQTDCFWKCGIRLGSDLKLTVYLGNEKQKTVKESIALKLV